MYQLFILCYYNIKWRFFQYSTFFCQDRNAHVMLPSRPLHMIFFHKKAEAQIGLCFFKHIKRINGSSQFDDCHRSSIAAACAGLIDPGVAALAILVFRSELVEKFVDNEAVLAVGIFRLVDPACGKLSCG